MFIALHEASPNVPRVPRIVHDCLAKGQILTEGPNSTKHDGNCKHKDLSLWNDKTMFSVAGAKTLMMSTINCFESWVLTTFSPFFQPLQHCVLELHRVIFTNRGSAKHGDVLSVLKDALPKLEAHDIEELTGGMGALEVM
jgi:hypothetical protein